MFKIEVKNLPRKYDIEDLKNLFQVFGTVMKIERPSKEGEEERLLLSYMEEEDMEEAIFNTDGLKFEEAYLQVGRAKKQKTDPLKAIWQSEHYQKTVIAQEQ